MPRHHHRPHPSRRMLMPSEHINDSPLMIAINRAAKLLPAELAELLTPVNTAFDAFRQGHGQQSHWAKLADALNIAEALAKRGIANDHLASFLEAQAALSAVHNRHSQNGSWVLRGPEIAAIAFALFVNKVQLSLCSRGELGFAVTDVINRVSQALAGNAGPGVRVLLPGQLGNPPTPAAAAA